MDLIKQITNIKNKILDTNEDYSKNTESGQN